MPSNFVTKKEKQSSVTERDGMRFYRGVRIAYTLYNGRFGEYVRLVTGRCVWLY